MTFHTLNQISCGYTHNYYKIAGVAGLQTITDNFDTELFLVNGDPDLRGGTFRNQLTILRLGSELDGVTVYCGIGAFPQQSKS